LKGFIDSLAPIFVTLLMSTIWILSSKNNTGETKLTNNYQAEQIIRHDETETSKCCT
jgi:hypothetical protein